MEEEPSAPHQPAPIEALPQPLLSLILEQLPAAELSRCGGVSGSFRRAAAAALRSRLSRLCRSIQQEMGALERRARAAQATGRQMLHVQRRHSVLRLLLAVVRVIRACCWRYMRRERWPLCVGAGPLLDEASSLLCAATERGPRLPHVDPGDAARLLLRAHDFLDHLDSRVEPALPARRTPFGVKMVDLLDCSQTAACRLVLTRQAGQPLFFLSGRYQMSCVRDAPPVVCRSSAPVEMKLQAVSRYVRGCVGWGDVLSTVRELWNREDAAQAATAAAPGPPLPPCSRQLQPQQEDDPATTPPGMPIRLVFTREGSREGDGSVLCCDVQLQGDARLHLPLDLEHLAADVPPLAPPPPPPPPVQRASRSCDDFPPHPLASWLSVASSETSTLSQGRAQCFPQAHSSHAGPPDQSEAVAAARDVVASLLGDVVPDTVPVPQDEPEPAREEVGVQTSTNLLYIGGDDTVLAGYAFEDTFLQSAGSEDSAGSCPTALTPILRMQKQPASILPPVAALTPILRMQKQPASIFPPVAEADWSYSFSMSMSLERPLYDGGLPHQQVLVMLTHSLSHADVSSYTDVDI